QSAVVDGGQMLYLPNGAGCQQQHPDHAGMTRAEGDVFDELHVFAAPPGPAVSLGQVFVAAGPALTAAAAAIGAAAGVVLVAEMRQVEPRHLGPELARRG